MSTPTDLRHALAAHAEGVPDLPAVERLAAVHGRVRDVRRRRRATVALAALAAILGVSAVAWLPDRGPAPVDRPTIGGVTAPKTLTSLGFGYDFAGAVTGDGSATLDLTASDRPRLMTWASDSGRVRLSSDQLTWDWLDPDDEIQTQTDFTGFHLILPGAVGRVTARGQGEVALAVYDLASLGPGVGDASLHFRAEVAGQQLVGSSLGELGQSQVSVTFTVPTGGYSLTGGCTGASRGYRFRIEIAHRQTIFGSCRTEDLLDGSGISGPDTHIRAGRTLIARMWLTHDDRDGTPLTDVPAGVRLGIAIYSVPAPTGRLGALDMPAEIEADGHTFAQVSRAVSEPAARRYTTTVTDQAGPVLFWFGGSRMPHRANVALFVNGTSGGATLGPGGASRSVVVPLSGDGRAVAVVRAAAVNPFSRLAIAVYRQVD